VPIALSEKIPMLTHPHKILIDAIFFQYNRSGIARVWRSLLSEWGQEYFGQQILVLDRNNTAPRIPGITYRTIPAHSYAAIDADRAMLQDICNEEHATLFISTFYTAPLDTPSVFMAYDMIPELLNWDPKTTPMVQQKAIGIAHASTYIAISKSTANDLYRLYPSIDKTAIFLSYCGVNFQRPNELEITRFKTQHSITKPYFLLVGHRGLYKNAQLFFSAFETLGEARKEYAIVCTGPWLALESEFANCVGAAETHMLEIDDDELQSAYAGAQALVYPSRYEGFGMPITEAMACGCPVITCPSGSIPEVAADAALYVAPDNVPAMQAALLAVLNQGTRSALVAKGFAQANKFSWNKMANEIKNILIDKAPHKAPVEAPKTTSEANQPNKAPWASAEAPSALRRIIPGEIVNDDFYIALNALARRPDLFNFLEIGSSSGAGSTQAFVSALSSRPDSNLTRLFCMELSRERYKALASSYANYACVKCYNQSSVALHEFPSPETVRHFYQSTRTTLNQYPLELVLSWLKEDMDYMRQSGLTSSGIDIIKAENNIHHFDMVLIDGSEFTGEAELGHVLGAKVIALDDVNSHKCFNVYQMLGHHVGYALTQQNLQTRNGYAVFERRY
jgi:glycosyltransferase involved in cell wall biosynthesis